MKRVGKEPRLLPNVMEAIASLKEKHGSTQKQIIEHISHILKKSKDNPRNMTMQIRRALEHGIQSGLIKQRSGKYVLGLDKRDYAIFRRFRQIDDPASDCYSCKRGRRRGRRGRRGRRRRSRRRGRRGRRRAISPGGEATEDSESGRSVAGGSATPEPMDRRARRRRRGRRGRRRGRRGRRRTTNHENSESTDSVRKDSNSAVPPEKRRSDQEKLDHQAKSSSNHNHHPERNYQDRNHQERNQEQEDEDINCGNPECLCNIKQEDDSPRCMSRENNYYDDSYLN